MDSCCQLTDVAPIDVHRPDAKAIIPVAVEGNRSPVRRECEAFVVGGKPAQVLPTGAVHVHPVDVLVEKEPVGLGRVDRRAQENDLVGRTRGWARSRIAPDDERDADDRNAAEVSDHHEKARSVNASFTIAVGVCGVQCRSGFAR
jgi:hypothetical protein